MSEEKDFIIIGGGAAGIFAALAAKKNDPKKSVCILEKTAVLLSKVKISGGGRCNVTHACFDPRQLVAYYPRGYKELLGPFHRFQPRDTIAWFEERGVPLKIEEDGRVFPISDSSMTIINCLMDEAESLGVEIRLKQKIQNIAREGSGYAVILQNEARLYCSKLLLATGSSAEGHRWSQELGHKIQMPVPSLFTFNIPFFPLSSLSGISVNPVEIEIHGTKFLQSGSLLITHFGFSGPAVLKLSAWGARYFHACSYQVKIVINWLPQVSQNEIYKILLKNKEIFPQKKLASFSLFSLPKNLWKLLCAELGNQKNCMIPDKMFGQFASRLHGDLYHVEGKTTHKEEFVTCGGIALEGIDFKTMESKECPGLFFAGELLDIDGVTGGFNFQNAWTTGYLAGVSACS
jgi:predicted Rossmann fold flavoprotein